jgi:hypothetical protein
MLAKRDRPRHLCGGRRTIVWFKAQIENWRVSVIATGMTKVNANMRLERTLVIGEADIAINAKQRAAGGPRIGDKERTDLVQLRRKTANE